MTDRLAARASFDDIADIYDRVRPGYPAEIIAELATLTRIRPGSRVLEIGCGTGQLTMPLLDLGATVTAVELGPHLAKIAAAKTGPRAEIVVADFDTWTGPRETFDVVVSATAFHWLDPETRLTRIAELLRPGGALATIATYHVFGGTEAFFAQAQREVYPHWYPSVDPDEPRPQPEEIGFDRDLERGGLFGPIAFRRRTWDAGYATADYLDLLRTYSTTLALAPRTRHGFLHHIGTIIDREHGGRITKRYMTELRVAVCAE
ncbi:MAG TPA: class I SAM-dependent methyltransferase [Pseudonocardiaceae bacterium]|nr:class I SAM-dependent methyltransferase [Pseudonocardiaceae bacterium]